MWSLSEIPQHVRMFACFLAVATAPVILLGCDPSDDSAPEERGIAEPSPGSVSEPVKPPPALRESVDVSGLLSEVSRAKNILAWYTLRESADLSIPEVKAAFDARERELLSESPARPISEDLELVGFDWKLDAAAPKEGDAATFGITWLFKVNKQIKLGPDQDLRLILRGTVDASHQHYLEGNKRDVDFSYVLDPPATSWKSGEYKRLDMKTYRKLPNIPYRIQTILSIVKKADDDTWRYDSRYGQAVDCGWHADLGEEHAPDTSAPSGADNPPEPAQ